MFEIASKLESLNLSFALVTIVKTKGIVPRKSGRMVVLPDGSSYGTVGGGDLERNAIKEIILAFKAKENRYILKEVKKLLKGKVKFYDTTVSNGKNQSDIMKRRREEIEERRI